MRILFDQGTPVPLRLVLAEKELRTAFELGWSTLSNGELLAAAEIAFDVLITTDRNLRHQQSVMGSRSSSSRRPAGLASSATAMPSSAPLPRLRGGNISS